MLGNEVDVYLEAHREEIPGYLAFLKAGRDLMHRLRPSLRVGVTTTYTGYQRDPALIEQVHSGMDIVSMTYYPLADDMTVLPVDGVGKHIDQMFAFAAPRKLYLQEVGYPSAQRLKSSDAKQRQFVDAVFDAAQPHSAQLLGMCFFLLVDMSDEMVGTLTKYYGLQAPNFVAYLATLGFKTQDGTPKAAWPEFKKRAGEF
jgi:hypothetical protein